MNYITRLATTLISIHTVLAEFEQLNSMYRSFSAEKTLDNAAYDRFYNEYLKGVVYHKDMMDTVTIEQFTSNLKKASDWNAEE